MYGTTMGSPPLPGTPDAAIPGAVIEPDGDRVIVAVPDGVIDTVCD